MGYSAPAYILFHHNLLFSAIPPAHYRYVIEEIYDRLLMLPESGIPIGVEYNGWTLEMISQISQKYIDRLKSLLRDGMIELVGSSYTQAIFPLIPARVNMRNLELGLKVYDSVLGYRPTLALLNEQVYSKGNIRLIRDTGYEGFLFDWPNAINGWEDGWVSDISLWSPVENEGIKIVWVDSVNTQRLQRVVWGDIDREDYELFVDRCLKESPFAFPVYGGDAEVFEYVPGTLRFSKGGRDMENLFSICRLLEGQFNLSWRLPSQLIEDRDFLPVDIATPDIPIRVKKQDKYNITRWAVTGRDAVRMNTQCYYVYNRLRDDDPVAHWRDLCFLWASDFRTNTTDEKYLEFRNKMGHLVETIDSTPRDKNVGERSRRNMGIQRVPTSTEEKGRYFIVETPSLVLSLIKNKGLAIDSLTFKDLSCEPLVGTVPHGYYRQISYAADYYSFHTILITQRGEQITDLNATCEVETEWKEGVLVVRNAESMDLGPISVIKEYLLEKDGLTVRYKLYFHDLYPMAMRLGMVTLLPQSFDINTLYYETHNGGWDSERFYVKGFHVTQDRAINQVVTASGCLGATEGYVVIGDASKAIRVTAPKDLLYNVPMVHFKELGGDCFFRLSHSVCERDDVANLFFKGYNEMAVAVAPVRSSS